MRSLPILIVLSLIFSACAAEYTETSDSSLQTENKSVDGKWCNTSNDCPRDCIGKTSFCPVPKGTGNYIGCDMEANYICSKIVEGLPGKCTLNSIIYAGPACKNPNSY